MELLKQEITRLFENARDKNEFEFVQVLMKYSGPNNFKSGSKLQEWFHAIDFYKTLYITHSKEEKYRAACLLYYFFFENTELYILLANLCSINLGYHARKKLFFTSHKKKMTETQNKIDMISELLVDSECPSILSFFSTNFNETLKKSFARSTYSIKDDKFFLLNSEHIFINGIGETNFEIKEFLIPKISEIIEFFNHIRDCFIHHFYWYRGNKVISVFDDEPVLIKIIGSSEGLKGLKIKSNSLTHKGDSEPENHQNWKCYTPSGKSIMLNWIEDTLLRYECKEDIENSFEIRNLTSKIIKRNNFNELFRIMNILVKFGNVMYTQWENETNPNTKYMLKEQINKFYRKAMTINIPVDFSIISKRLQRINSSESMVHSRMNHTAS
ncbi:MAG: hypothetical protein CL613_06795 [Aquimarina sp.]|nr:hypothetical protein [Aquimarina sp.]